MLSCHVLPRSAAPCTCLVVGHIFFPRGDESLELSPHRRDCNDRVVAVAIRTRAIPASQPSSVPKLDSFAAGVRLDFTWDTATPSCMQLSRLACLCLGAIPAWHTWYRQLVTSTIRNRPKGEFAPPHPAGGDPVPRGRLSLRSYVSAFCRSRSQAGRRHCCGRRGCSDCGSERQPPPRSGGRFLSRSAAAWRTPGVILSLESRLPRKLRYPTPGQPQLFPCCHVSGLNSKDRAFLELPCPTYILCLRYFPVCRPQAHSETLTVFPGAKRGSTDEYELEVRSHAVLWV